MDKFGRRKGFWQKKFLGIPILTIIIVVAVAGTVLAAWAITQTGTGTVPVVGPGGGESTPLTAVLYTDIGCQTPFSGDPGVVFSSAGQGGTTTVSGTLYMKVSDIPEDTRPSVSMVISDTSGGTVNAYTDSITPILDEAGTVWTVPLSATVTPSGIGSMTFSISLTVTGS